MKSPHKQNLIEVNNDDRTDELFRDVFDIYDHEINEVTIGNTENEQVPEANAGNMEEQREDEITNEDEIKNEDTNGTEHNEEEGATLGQKRKKETTRWKANKAHQARHAGQAYTSKEGKFFPAKELGPGCDESCYLNCKSKISMSERSKAKDGFYQMPNQVRKWEYIRFYVKTTTPKKIKDKNKPCRKTSNQYFLPAERAVGKDGKVGKKTVQIRVCQTMFLHTLVISDYMVRTALSKQTEGGGAILGDKRGGRKEEVLVPEEVTQSMDEHIAKFPRVPSHYCRANSNYEYLEADLENVSNMHRLYVLWMKENGKNKIATERQYRDYFNELPIKIHKPKKDLCELCVAYDIAKEKTEDDVKIYEDHIMRKDLVNSMYETDRTETAPANKGKVSICAFDLQKILLLPKSNAGALYYKRKISNFNFTIYDLGSHEGFCFVYNEGIGKKGANEIASYVWVFIEKAASSGIQIIRFYSDNATSQNKNRFLISMYILACLKFGIRIEHRYLVAGHTHNAADNMHALIERKTKKRDVFTTEQWCSIMENAKVTGKKYEVKRVTQDDIFDFHPLGEHLNFQKIRLTELVEIACDPKKPLTLEVKYDFSDTAVPVNVKSRKAGRPICLETYELPRAYQAPLPITKKKKKDLDELIEAKIIPEEYVSFYQDFKVGNEDENEADNIQARK